MVDRDLMSEVEEAYCRESDLLQLEMTLSVLRRESERLRDSKRDITPRYIDERRIEKTGSTIETIKEVALCIAGIIFFGIIFSSCSRSAYNYEGDIGLFGIIILGIPLFFIGACIYYLYKAVSMYKKEKADYVRAQTEEWGRVEREEEAEKKRITENTRYNANVDVKCRSISQAINELEDKKIQMKTSLERFYAKGRIKKSFQDLISISKIYFFLENEICDKLEGGEGAYSKTSDYLQMDAIAELLRIGNYQRDQIRIDLVRKSDLLEEILHTNQALQRAVSAGNSMTVNLCRQIESYQARQGSLLDEIQRNQQTGIFLQKCNLDANQNIASSLDYLEYVKRAERGKLLEQPY